MTPFLFLNVNNRSGFLQLIKNYGVLWWDGSVFLCSSIFVVSCSVTCIKTILGRGSCSRSGGWEGWIVGSQVREWMASTFCWGVVVRSLLQILVAYGGYSTVGDSSSFCTGEFWVSRAGKRLKSLFFISWVLGFQLCIFANIIYPKLRLLSSLTLA